MMTYLDFRWSRNNQMSAGLQSRGDEHNVMIEPLICHHASLR